MFMLTSLLLCHGAAQTVSPSPTASPSTPCAAGWSYYSDIDGSEGTASCLKVTGTDTFHWTIAMDACPMNSHLLTMAGTSKNSGLHAYSRTVSGDNFWIGASQSSTATSVNREWAWIDGTPSGNSLNCGAPGGQGCGLWSSNEPKCVYPCLPTFSWNQFQ